MRSLIINVLIFINLNNLFADHNVSIVPNNFKEFKSHPKLPAINYLTESGNFESINTFKGKKTIIHFWATWCNPCVKELPLLDELIGSNKAKDFNFLLISADIGGANAILDFLNKYNIKNIGAASDPNGDIQRVLNIRGLPTTLIINQNGELVYKAEGEVNWKDNKIIEFLNLL